MLFDSEASLDPLHWEEGTSFSCALNVFPLYFLFFSTRTQHFPFLYKAITKIKGRQKRPHTWNTLADNALHTSWEQQLRESHGRKTSQDPFWALQYKSNMDILEKVQQTATDLIKGVEHLFCEESLRQLGLFVLKKRRLKGDLSSMCKYLKEDTKRTETGFS